MAAPPLIVTATLDRASFEFFDGLRRKHFPPERNFLSAHLTLFHNLPGDEIDSVKATITEVSSDLRPLPVSFTSMRFMGRGVAVNVDSVQLIGLRRRLAAAFEPWLTPQDRQKFQPHITIQNKVEPGRQENCSKR